MKYRENAQTCGRIGLSLTVERKELFIYCSSDKA